MTTKIEWTDETWNPVTGCTKVSPGCDSCYAEIFSERFRDTPGHYFENGFDVQLRPAKLTQPLRWKKPRRIFVNSMSDLFHEKVPTEYIAKVWAVMAHTPHHTYQLLTKRHGRMRAVLSSPDFRTECEKAEAELVSAPDTPGLPRYRREQYARQWWSNFASPLPNLWLGVSVEDQKRANLRIPFLLQTPAAIRFLSCEPLLGPVDLKQAVIPMGSERGHGLTASYVHTGGCCERGLHGIDWVIAGGESGHPARPADPDWFRLLRDQCTHSGVPFFFKQWGEWAPSGYHVIRNRPEPGSVLVGDPVDDLGHRIEMRRVGKKRAGRLLDGRHHDAVPACAR